MLLQFVAALSSGFFSREIATYTDNKLKYLDIITPLHDVYYNKYVPPFMHLPILNDIVTYSVMVIWILQTDARTFEEQLIKASFLYFIRGVAIGLTSGYSSYRHASGLYNEDERNMSRFFSDLVVSGHVGVVWLLIFEVLGRCAFYKKIIWIFMGTMSVAVNLLVGDHYCSDIWLGIILAGLVQTSRLF